MACGKIREKDRGWLHKHFAKQGWELLDEPWLRERLKAMSEQGYKNLERATQRSEAAKPKRLAPPVIDLVAEGQPIKRDQSDDYANIYVPCPTRACHNSTVSKFKIGQSVHLVPSVGGTALGEYRVVERLPQAGKSILYRVRSSADERSEMVVKESELRDRRYRGS